MDNSIYVAISKQTALQGQMNLVANNIANMNTAGYRSQHALFEEYMQEQDSIAELNDPISMVQNYGQYDDMSAGPVKTTGNTLDIALQGPGFLGVVTPGGIEYTRGGNLSMNTNGELVTATGFPVADAGGAPIIIPDGERGIVFSKDGTISSENGALGLYKTEGAPLPAQNTSVMQGAVEGSNVNPILEMTRMIEISRNYQSTHKFMQGEHDLQLDSIKKLARVS